MARVAPSFFWRAIGIALLCLVLGVWGIWDYVVAIPKQSMQWHRAEVARTYNRVAEPIINGSTTEVAQQSLDAFSTAVLSDLMIEDDPAIAAKAHGLQAVIDASDSNAALEKANALLLGVLLQAQQNTNEQAAVAVQSQQQWLALIAGMVQAAQTPMTLNGPNPQLGKLLVLSNQALQIWGDVQPPSKYDRPMQWMFILCLPFVPWYLRQALGSKRQKYALDEDGTLHTPQGTLQATDIAEIDMYRWMAKSKAWVVATDGRRILLDDYIFKNLWKIVGVLAAKHHPEDWTEDAKPVKNDVDIEPDEVSGEDDADKQPMDS